MMKAHVHHAALRRRAALRVLRGRRGASGAEISAVLAAFSLLYGVVRGGGANSCMSETAKRMKTVPAHIICRFDSEMYTCPALSRLDLVVVTAVRAEKYDLGNRASAIKFMQDRTQQLYVDGNCTTFSPNPVSQWGGKV